MSETIYMAGIVFMKDEEVYQSCPMGETEFQSEVGRLINENCKIIYSTKRLTEEQQHILCNFEKQSFKEQREQVSDLIERLKEMDAKEDQSKDLKKK